MTLDEVDAELALWKKSLSAAAQNLMDLQSLPTYQRLAGSNGVPKADLQGVTAARVYPALDSMGKLFQHFDDLQCTIDRASELRRQISPIFGSDQKLREIETILHGKSVRLPPVPVPIEQRTLSTVAEHDECVSPADLMGVMDRGFTAARNVVLSVDAAWQKLGLALDHAITDLDDLKTEAEKWKVSFPALDKAEAALQTIGARIETDPLAAAEEFENSVAPVLHQARTALTGLKAQRAQLTAALSNAGKLLSQLTDLHQESLTSWNDRRLKVNRAPEPAPPQPDEKVATLRDWLMRLDEKFHQGMLHPISVGLEKWNKAAAEFVLQERAALNANQAPVKERNELRGRLEALKAKARARGSAEHPELTRIAAEATKLLFNRPTPIDQASALVVDYERVLRTQLPDSHENFNE